MRQSTKAKKTPRAQKAERQAHFRAARSRHEFSDSALQRYGIRLRSKDGTGPEAEKTWIGERLGAHEVQVLASRAYRATNEHLLGTRGRPRFEGKGQCPSVEGKGPGSGLRWQGDHVVWGAAVAALAGMPVRGGRAARPLQRALGEVRVSGGRWEIPARRGPGRGGLAGRWMRGAGAATVRAAAGGDLG